MARFCVNCGNALDDNVKFCTCCGTSNIQPVHQNIGQSVRKMSDQLTGDVLNMPGEIDLGIFGDTVSNAVNMARQGAVQAGNIASVSKETGFRKATAFISSIALAIVWIIQLVWIKNGVDNPIAKLTEWLTFARGGLNRSFFGGIGGIIGKGVFASALAGIVGGGIGTSVAGLKRSFSVDNLQKNTAGYTFIGWGISFVLYQIFTGNGSFAGVMAAVSGMLVAARSAGGGAGLLFGFARSVTSKKQGNTKQVRNEALTALLGGITMGFAIAIPLSVIPWDYMHLFFGFIFIVVGLVFSLVNKNLCLPVIVALALTLSLSEQVVHAAPKNFLIESETKGEQKHINYSSLNLSGQHVNITDMFDDALQSAGEIEIVFDGYEYHMTIPGCMYSINEDAVGPNKYPMSVIVETGDYHFTSSAFSMQKGNSYYNGAEAETYGACFTLDAPVSFKQDYSTLKRSPSNNKGVPHSYTVSGEITDMNLYLSLYEDRPDGNVSACIKVNGDADLTSTFNTESANTPSSPLFDNYSDGFMMVAKGLEPGYMEDADPITQEITTEADIEAGEKEFDIDEDIVEGKQEKEEERPQVEPEEKPEEETENKPAQEEPDTVEEPEEQKDDGGISGGAVAALGVGGIAAGIGGAAAAGKSAKQSGGNKDDAEDKKKKYKMKVYKDFGNKLSKGDQKFVYARIVEIDTRTGQETDRPDLTMNIYIICTDGSFNVSMQEALAGNYKGAAVSVADSFEGAEGYIQFRYSGIGGAFTNHMRFMIGSPEIVFDQPNISIPHDHNEPLKPYFVCLGFGEDLDITASILPDNVYKVNITEGESTGLDFAKLYYANLIPVSGVPSMQDREPGSSEQYSLHIEARDSAGLWAEANLPIARIRTGLILTTKTIDCFFNKKVASEITPGDGLRRYQVQYTSLAETNAELKLVVWDDTPEEHRVKVMAPLPKSLKFKTEDPEEQVMIDKMAIQMDPGDEPVIGDDGGLRVKLRVTKAWLDAPRRIKAKMTVEAEADGKVYSCEQDVLLCSQPNRNGLNMEQFHAAVNEDKQIEERLEHLKEQIHTTCYLNLFPVHKVIDQMLLAYDPQYGYDRENVATVINTYNSFCRGETLGANAKPAEGESVIDWMLWAIDAMGDAADRLEEKAGFWTRLAIGVATAGLSEVAFTTMDIVRIPYRMKQAIDTGTDSVLGVMWAGAKDIVLGEIQGKGMEWAQGAGWTMAKAFAADAEGAVGKKIFKIMTKSEEALTAYTNKVQSVNSKTTINKEMFQNVFKPEVNAQAANARAKEAKLSQAEADLEADKLIKEARQKDLVTEVGEVTAATEHGVIVETLPDGSQRVVGRDLSDPWTRKSLEGYEKVVELHRATENLRNSKTPEAQARYDKAAAEVRSDFVAGNHLKNYNNIYAKDVQYTYNQHWDAIDARADKLAGDNLFNRLKSENPGLKRDDIYTRSVTTNKDNPYKNKMDHDMTDMMKRGQGEADIEINDRIQFEENAKAAYEAVTGKKPTNLDEAIRIAEKYQYTTVAGEGVYAKEKFADVKGMLDPKHAGDALKNPLKDAEVMQYKTQEFVDRANATDNLVEKVMNLCEAGRTTQKDMVRSIISRNEALMMKGHPNALTKEDQILCVLLDRAFGKGAKTGHLEMTPGDFYQAMKALGIENGTSLALKMKELTLRVSGGD